MDHAFPEPQRHDVDAGASLRFCLRAAQEGAGDSYRDLLHQAAARWRRRGASEAEVQRALILLDRLHHTYDPKRCPLRWVDAILSVARGRHPPRA